jgi:hypothetical protein
MRVATAGLGSGRLQADLAAPLSVEIIRGGTISSDLRPYESAGAYLTLAALDREVSSHPANNRQRRRP